MKSYDNMLGTTGTKNNRKQYEPLRFRLKIRSAFLKLILRIYMLLNMYNNALVTQFQDELDDFQQKL